MCNDKCFHETTGDCASCWETQKRPNDTNFACLSHHPKTITTSCLSEGCYEQQPCQICHTGSCSHCIDCQDSKDGACASCWEPDDNNFTC